MVGTAHPTAFRLVRVSRGEKKFGSSGLSVLLVNPHYSKASGIECVLLSGLRTLIMAFSPFPPFEQGKGEAKHDSNHAN